MVPRSREDFSAGPELNGSTGCLGTSFETSIHPHTQKSSSTVDGVVWPELLLLVARENGSRDDEGGKGAGGGRRNCEWDHSDEKYFGKYGLIISNCFCLGELRSSTNRRAVSQVDGQVHAKSHEPCKTHSDSRSDCCCRFSRFVVVRSHTCTVPLSLLTHSALPSRLSASAKIAAASVPRRSSFTSRLELGSHTRINVPVELAVASTVPAGFVAIAASADVCAMMIETAG